jgi:hypothetical protein
MRVKNPNFVLSLFFSFFWLQIPVDALINQKGVVVVIVGGGGVGI